MVKIFSLFFFLALQSNHISTISLSRFFTYDLMLSSAKYCLTNVRARRIIDYCLDKNNNK